MLLDRGAQCKLTATIWLSSIPSIRIVILDVLLWTLNIELPSLNYYSLGRWLLLWKAGYASSIGGGWNQCWSIHFFIQSSFSISISIISGLIHRTICHRVSTAIRIVGRNTFAPSVAICIVRTICHRVSAAIRIARPICLFRRQQYVCIARTICHRLSAAICMVNQYVIQNRQQYALITPIYHQVQYD